MIQHDLPPIHPGEQLREEFMRPIGLTAPLLARDIDLPLAEVWEIIEETRSITSDTALRLSRYFSTTPEFWLNMQRDYDLARAIIESGSKIRDTVNPRAA